MIGTTTAGAYGMHSYVSGSAVPAFMGMANSSCVSIGTTGAIHVFASSESPASQVCYIASDGLLHLLSDSAQKHNIRQKTNNQE